MNPALQERIERGSVPEPNTGCWLWVGSLGAAGYGTISIGPKKMSAHRASYTAFVGEIPDGKVVRHGCDVKSCVNPQHLSLGTHRDNILDAVSRHPDKYRTYPSADLKTRLEEGSIPEPNSGCWLWTGSIMSLGYGQMLVNGKKLLVHRIAYEAHFGEIPKGMLVLHMCDTRMCVNPQHLELGGHRDKMRAKTRRAVQSRRTEPLDLKERMNRLSVPEPNTGCHLWTGTIVKSTGYGETKVGGKKMSAHRAAWIAHRGEVPVEMVVMHGCDVRSCINIDHLSIGTRKDNSADMASKQRGGFDKLTREQRVEMSKRAMQTLGPDGLKARADARKASIRRAKEARLAARQPSMRFNLLAPRAA